MTFSGRTSYQDLLYSLNSIDLDRGTSYRNTNFVSLNDWIAQNDNKGFVRKGKKYISVEDFLIQDKTVSANFIKKLGHEALEEVFKTELQEYKSGVPVDNTRFESLFPSLKSCEASFPFAGVMIVQCNKNQPTQTQFFCNDLANCRGYFNKIAPRKLQ